MNPYSESIEHVRDELGRLDLLVQRALLLARHAESASGAGEFRGLVISEPEVDTWLKTPDFFGERWQRAEMLAEKLAPIDQRLAERRAEIDARRKASGDLFLALPALAQCFNLSAAEVDILLVTLAPELEPRYETLYGYLQNDVTRKHPSVNLALNLVCRSEREKLNARAIFTPCSRLFWHRLLWLSEEAHDRQPSLLRKFLKLDEAVVGYLLEQEPATAGTSTLITPQRAIEELEMEPADRNRIENLATLLRSQNGPGVVIHLCGESDASLRDAAEALCAAVHRKLLLVEFAGLEANVLPSLRRDAGLHEGVLAIHVGNVLEQETQNEKRVQAQADLWHALARFNEPVFLLGPASAFVHIPPEIRLWRVEVPSPSFTHRQRAWDTALGKRGANTDTARLADTFRFGSPRIRQTLELATGLAYVRNPSAAGPATEELIAAGRALTTPDLGRFAVPLEPRYTWTDIVLPAEKMQQLRHVAAWMKFRRTIHREWGFGEKLSRGKGLIVLFTGPTGTGKTMAAEILARELCLELFQIDLSSVVSKYIGETEKNLSAIFRGAEESQALLFFDEADALFGKRTEVKDAHDRYANIEVNYLLQRVEQYKGVVILATNMQRNLDEAFLRRIQEVIEFPFPDESSRERIWRAHFPAEAPRGEDIDFQFLARQFKVAGGSIKNIAPNAALRAAQDGGVIGMEHLILATKTEFQKQGKLCMKTDFGPYYELIQKEGAR
jgi:ATPase family associated with various cellular activities (AAA)